MVPPTKHGKKCATILVTGPTGSGKTTFANLVSKSKLRVASSSAACTERVQATRQFDVNGCTVILVDTPGLDCTSNANGEEALTLIRTFLVDQYERGQMMTGMIYVHPIDDEEAVKTDRNLSAFEVLCGDKALQNMAIVTSKWDLGDAESVQRFEQREQELRTGSFARVINKGAHMFRDDQGMKSAREVVEYLIQKQPTPLQVQRSIVDGSLRLQHTGTGHILLRDLSKDSQTQEEMLRQLQMGESQGESETTSSRIKLKRVENKMRGSKRHAERRHHTKQVDRWNFGEMMVFVCCVAALYAFMTVLKQHIWRGMVVNI